jgi:hypothetical protein
MKICDNCETEFEEGRFFGPEGRPWCELCCLRDANAGLALDLKWARRSEDNLRTQLESEKEKLVTEREGLISWMCSRRAQQQQILDMNMAKQTKELAEIEISFIERYLEVIRSGKHRNNNPAVSSPDSREFKTLRTLEREDIQTLIGKDLAEVRKKMRRNRSKFEEAENVLVTLLDQITAEEHRR